jgi:hypothetical protein
VPRKAERERIAGTAVGKGTPAGLIRRPIKLPPMVNIKDGPAFDSDEDYEVDERLGDELAKVEEQIG